ncbi:MAG: 4Fe-4S binding protein [Phycisphaerales bacterium]|nr:MAG: 4Fe-4S binding protein [Phycisphaerales bacterium]
MRFARGMVIFSYGLFTIAAQTLLFREYLTTFEGNDISVGLFFGSWFLWVGLGATVVYRAKSLAEKLLTRIELLFLSYIPAFVLQFILILEARELAGVESYALLSIRATLVLSVLVNAPVSLVTGALFPLACRWLEREKATAVSHVYIMEAAGSLVGGLAATFLLGFGASSARVFLIIAFILCLTVFAASVGRLRHIYGPAASGRRARVVLQLLVLLAIVLCLSPGVDGVLMRRLRTAKWTKLLPKEALLGSFQTPQAEYLYGIYQDQWVAMREGSVCEALPDSATAGQTAAVSLCQNPEARRVLIVGSGLGLAREFLRLPHVEQVTWTGPDDQYVQRVMDFIPKEFSIADKRFERPAGDVRTLLARNSERYDIVIINLPDATSSVLNRYYTLEFYRLIKNSLTANGIVAVRVAGGENIMGTELVNLGASAKLTLGRVFSEIVLTPGDDTWFVASDSGRLTGDPATLRDRFAQIEGGSEVFSPQGLLSVYLPGRAAAALESYAAADLPAALLVNRDSRPLTHLYSLLLAARHSGAPVTELVKHLALAGPAAFVAPILLFLILRMVYLLKTKPQGRTSGFESTFLVFSAGWVGIGVVIALMYLYQTHFGSLYLHIGIISSLFMVGLTIGALAVNALLRPSPKQRDSGVWRPPILLLCVIVIHSLILAAIAVRPSGQWRTPSSAGVAVELSQVVFAAAFIVCGLCTGCYFPIAARQLAAAGFETGAAAGRLETADHIGASVGGIITSLALVPILGTKAALLVLLLLILANVPATALRMLKLQKAAPAGSTAFGIRRLGYILFGIAAAIIVCSNLMAEAGARLRPSLPLHAARALAGELEIERESAGAADGSARISYFKVCDAQQKTTGYIFSTEELAPEVRGFGGRMNIGAHVDASGKLLDFHIIRSNETPSYLRLLTDWQESLKGRNLFEPDSFADVDAVTGATVSSNAITSALQSSARKFAAQVLNLAVGSGQETPAGWREHIPDAPAFYLIGAFLLAMLVTRYGGFRARLAVLILSLVIGGLILNTQYSSEQIASLLSVQTPAVGLTGAFLLVVAAPFLILVLGNIYCGYICPFGAAQELVGYLVPEKFKPSVSTAAMRNARFVKYVLLFVVVAAFFLSRNRTTLAQDPLISVFHRRFGLYELGPAMLVILAIALVGSLLFSRFWCRYLCPAGAFLSLLNAATFFKRLLPPKRFAKCEFGLSARDHADCIHCDRCRYGPGKAAALASVRPPEPAPTRAASRYFVTFVLATAIFVSTLSARRFLQVAPVRVERDYSTAFAPSAGEPRDVDLQRIRTMIRQNKLSDHEAEFYSRPEQQ